MPCLRASANDIITSAAAPSESGALVAAVTVPSLGRNAGSSRAIASRLVSRRTD